MYTFGITFFFFFCGVHNCRMFFGVVWFVFFFFAFSDLSMFLFMYVFYLYMFFIYFMVKSKVVYDYYFFLL